MPDKAVLFKTRFMADVDARLREHISRRGELLQLIVLILKTVDLSTIPLLEISSDLQDLAATSVKLPASLHAKLKRVAAKRQSSMNALMNSAVLAYTEKKAATKEDR
jgi:hypothetical protein